MKLVVQRVSQASVAVNGEVVGAISQGLLVLLGITHTDTVSQVNWLASKLVNLRIFEDEQGKMNRSLLDMQGHTLIISQFTLYGDCNEGRRPSFTQAARPEQAEPLYMQFVEEVRKAGIVVQTGIFAADMQVSLVNDGPVTMLLERD